MGKRNAYENILQQNCGPQSKKVKLHHNGDAAAAAAAAAAHNVVTTPVVESPKPEFQLQQDIVNGQILTDISNKKWRIGKAIGKGSFGEIFLASDDIARPVTSENAKYVVKIEPHSNGPLFVEIHCLINAAKQTDEKPLPPGMPEYIASGSHYFRNTRYRFLVLPRYDCDLHSLIKNRRVNQKSILILAVQILDILQHLHDKGYCHSDIKAENLMIGKCTFKKSTLKEESSSSSSSSCNSSDDEFVDEALSNETEGEREDDDDDEDYEEDFNDHKTTKRKKPYVQYSGSNPVRSCRLKKRNSTYQEMVKTHYLRPAKKINYSEFFNDENSKSGEEDYTLDEFIQRTRISNGRKENSRIYDQYKVVTENRIFLIDFGLASKFVDSSGQHRPFCMDQRRAHDGTLEFTSRDAHMGAHSRRSDLECLGYNLIYWSQGSLPWKEAAAQQQHEKVHACKEFLMTDVKEMLKHVYGESVPKYLGVFMHYVGKLAYQDRPDYKKCKRIFEQEFERLGYKKNEMVLDLTDLKKKAPELDDATENNNDAKNLKSIMNNLGLLLPFREHGSNRISPKNLRSKSDKLTNKKRKKFSWAEILSQDPDQIARERAEKEFEREETADTPLTKYSGRPTYAILAIENKMKFKDRLDAIDSEEEEVLIKGYTKPMMDVLKKRQSNLMAEMEEERKMKSASKQIVKVSRPRAKSGLRTVITPTKRALDYNHTLVQRRAKRSHKNSGDFTTDESSCSSLNSVASSTATHKKSQCSSNSTSSSLRGGVSSSLCASGISDDDSQDITVYSPKKVRGLNNNNAASINKTLTPAVTPKVDRRKKSTPRKKKVKTEIMRCV